MQDAPFETLKARLKQTPRKWLITGVAGFIGSNLLERLLELDQHVVGLDNLTTGKKRNLLEVQSLTPEEKWERFTFIEGDIRDPDTCREACRGVDYVLHQAAMGSVPLSIEKPLESSENNIRGTLNMLVAARDERVRRFVYASSSSVYGSSPELPKVEDVTGTPLSPYAVTKATGELYADVFARNYGMETIGLRYFNVFGPRQDPNGHYAAVIPKWVGSMIRGEPACINGTGETSRDFCFIENVIQVNLLAAATENPEAVNQVYNVALGSRTTLNELFGMLRVRLLPHYSHLADYKPVYRPFRAGDIMHSLADISKARRLLGYAPTHTIDQGLDEAIGWYMAHPA
ncbi:MAG: SDR family oxidoreductase [Acidobacteriota bacterium]